MPTLLQINTTLNWGSTGRIAEQIAMLAESYGWNCFIAHGGRYVGKSNCKSIQISSRLDNLIHAFYGEFFGCHGLGSSRSTKAFVNVINEIKPDIVHLHNIHGYYLNYQILFDYLAQTKIPVVWTLHDCWSFTGHCTHFENKGCEKWKVECNHCPLLMAQYKSRFVDRSKDNFLLKKELYNKLENVTIVPVSHWLGNLVSQSILNKFPIQVIQNGINLDLFKPTANSIRDRFSIPFNTPIILGVISSGFGNGKGRKEFEFLAKNIGCQVILVGLSDKEKKGLPSNIIALGRTASQKELAEFYSAADIFLNPTYDDTFPTTNLEALACGTPVITFHTGGSPESIDDNTGIVINKGDTSALTDAIRTILSKGKMAYSSVCRERAVRLYNKDERFMDYINLYDYLLRKNSK